MKYSILKCNIFRVQAGPAEEGCIVTPESKALATLLSHDSVSADASSRARIERLSQVPELVSMRPFMRRYVTMRPFTRKHATMRPFTRR
jgi:hypothetical protein